MSNSSIAEATFTCTNGKIMGRIIGTGGSGTKRITNTTRSQFADSAPYLRGDRATNTIRLTARGKNAQKAVRFMAQMVLNEQNWATGKTTVCPHPHAYVSVDNPDHVRHVIGQGGSGLRNLCSRAGTGVFIVHKPDLSSYLIEATTESDVGAAKTLLLERIRRIAVEQVASQTTSVDIGDVTPSAKDDTPRCIEKIYVVPPRAHPGDAICTISTPWKTTVNIKVPAGHNPGDRFTVKIPYPIHDAVDTTSGFTTSRDYNQSHQVAREAVAQTLACHPSQVSDRQIQDYLRAQEESLSSVPDTSQSDVDTISTDSDHFPSMQSTLRPPVTLKVTEIDQRMAAIDAELQADRLVGEQELLDIEADDHLDQYNDWLDDQRDLEKGLEQWVSQDTSPAKGWTYTSPVTPSIPATDAPKEFLVDPRGGYITDSPIPNPSDGWVVKDNVYTFSAKTSATSSVDLDIPKHESGDQLTKDTHALALDLARQLHANPEAWEVSSEDDAEDQHSATPHPSLPTLSRRLARDLARQLQADPKAWTDPTEDHLEDDHKDTSHPSLPSLSRQLALDLARQLHANPEAWAVSSEDDAEDEHKDTPHPSLPTLSRRLARDIARQLHADPKAWTDSAEDQHKDTPKLSLPTFSRHVSAMDSPTPTIPKSSPLIPRLKLSRSRRVDPTNIPTFRNWASDDDDDDDEH